MIDDEEVMVTSFAKAPQDIVDHVIKGYAKLHVDSLTVEQLKSSVYNTIIANDGFVSSLESCFIAQMIIKTYGKDVFRKLLQDARYDA